SVGSPRQRTKGGGAWKPSPPPKRETNPPFPQPQTNPPPPAVLRVVRAAAGGRGTGHARRPACDCPRPEPGRSRSPAAARLPALPPEGEGGHLPAHQRRGPPTPHPRLQTRTDRQPPQGTG